MENIDEILNGYEEFRTNVINKHGELAIISKQLSEVNNSENYLDHMDFFFGYYFPAKYGEEAANFLFTLLSNSKKVIKLLTEKKLINTSIKAELDLLAYFHNELIRKISSNFEHPYSLRSTSVLSNKDGEYLLSLKRLDGQSINIFLNVIQSFKLLNNILEVHEKNIKENITSESEREIIDTFITLSKKVELDFKDRD
ncbi:hypothetical protein [Robertmurraya sp. P23]|uniref:hypothetical protein n=1 Tax=Robertmurraya sp. P23 TaxID=3436931 RepID=UPI003D98A6F7